MKIKRVKNKLLKSGYLPELEHLEYEKWIDVRQNGTPISFYKTSEEGGDIKGSLHIHGRRSDVPEADLWYSTWSENLSEAIRLSRC